MANISYTKLTDKKKKKILADYIERENYCEVARLNNVTEACVRKIVKNWGDDEVKKLFEQKKEENTLSTLDYMQTQHEAKKRILDKILKAIEEKSENIDMFTNIKDLATAYGIIVDKELKALEVKNSSNNAQELSKLDELLTEIKNNANK